MKVLVERLLWFACAVCRLDLCFGGHPTCHDSVLTLHPLLRIVDLLATAGCTWAKHENKTYAKHAGFAGIIGVQFNITAAKKHCIDLGIDKCKAVSCEIPTDSKLDKEVAKAKNDVILNKRVVEDIEAKLQRLKQRKDADVAKITAVPDAREGVGVCGLLTPTPATNCPFNVDLENCDKVGYDAYCEGDGECGTNPGLNNCHVYDVYWKTHAPLTLDRGEGRRRQNIIDYKYNRGRMELHAKLTSASIALDASTTMLESEIKRATELSTERCTLVAMGNPFAFRPNLVDPAGTCTWC